MTRARGAIRRLCMHRKLDMFIQGMFELILAKRGMPYFFWAVAPKISVPSVTSLVKKN